MGVVEGLILPGIILILAYFRTPTRVWVPVTTIILTALTLYGQQGVVYLLIAWLLILPAIFFSISAKFRLRYLTGPLAKQLQKRLPPMSETEKAAIDSGDVFWEKELFGSKPSWKKLLAMPAPKLSDHEQAFLDNQVNQLCSMLNDWQMTEQLRDMPPSVWNYLKQERFFGLVLPEEHGGRGFSALAVSSIITKIATRSISAAVSVMVPNSLGPGELLLHYGTNEQKYHYLPRLAAGEEIPCFALTSPHAGSDAGSITDTGIVCRGEFEGREIVGIRLNWDKRYITLAPVATLLGIAVQLSDPENLLGKGVSPGITLCLVSSSMPGVETGNRHYPLYLAIMNGPTRGRNVFVPLNAIIGGPAMAGEGWRMLMECLALGRGISLPALSTAQGMIAYRITGAYARLRRQFNLPIGNFEGVAECLGHVAGTMYLLESCRIFTASAVDQKIRPAIASAIAKYHMTEMGRKSMQHAMDIHGGHGIQMGPHNMLATPYVSCPVSITVEGANILSRNLIIFGQGAIRCHPYLLEETMLLSADSSPARNRRLDRLLFSHSGYFISLLVRNFWYGLTGGRLIHTAVKGKTAVYSRQLTRMSAALALITEVTLLVLGGELKRRERVSARLGDMMSQLYLASAAIKYFHDQGQPSSDLDFVKWSLESCLYNTQLACEELLENYPTPWLGKLLYRMIFLFGRAWRKPADSLHHKLAASMQQASGFRQRLTGLFFQSSRPDDPARKIEDAFLMAEKVEPLIKKFNKAVRTGLTGNSLHEAMNKGILTSSEAETVSRFNALYEEVIRVDEFSFDLETVLTPEPPACKEEIA